jgi:hypothetical protein
VLEIMMWNLNVAICSEVVIVSTSHESSTTSSPQLSLHANFFVFILSSSNDLHSDHGKPVTIDMLDTRFILDD